MIYILILLCLFPFLFIIAYRKKLSSKYERLSRKEQAERKEIFQSVIHIMEMDQERLAKNVHDDIGTLLSVIKLNLAGIAKNNIDEKLQGHFGENVMNLLDEAIENTRCIAKELMPNTLVKLGYERAISEFCRQINNSGKITVHVDFFSEGFRFPAAVEQQLYRVTKELINNILKHSEASTISLSNRITEGIFMIRISHDGIGISSEAIKLLTKTSGGIGLKSIHSRLELIDGTIKYITDNKKNAQIIIQIPLCL